MTVALALLLPVASGSAQAPPHIQAAQEFLLGWGKANWDAVKMHAADKVTVKVGGADYALDAAGKRAEVQLIFPFRGLAAVRVGANVKGVTVDEITVRAGGAERKGKGTVTLEEKDGKFTVTSVAVE
jgi:hypothetical protein